MAKPKEMLLLLKGVRALLAKPYGWTKRHLHIVNNKPDGSAVHAYCLMGAFSEVYGSTDTRLRSYQAQIDAERVVVQCIRQKTKAQRGYVTLPLFNDAETTKKKDILEVLDCAIAKTSAKITTRAK